MVASGNSPLSIVTAGVNGDGKPELIVANADAGLVDALNNITVPGATTPGFYALIFFTSGNVPASVSAVDVNGDNRPDLITANFGDDTIP